MRKPILWFLLAVILAIPGAFFLSHGVESLQRYRHIRDNFLPELTASSRERLAAMESGQTVDEVERYAAELEYVRSSYRSGLEAKEQEKTTARDRLVGGGALVLLAIAAAVFGFTRRRRSPETNHLRASDPPANVGGDAPAPTRADPGVA